MKKLLALVLLSALLLTGCHGHLVTDAGESARQYTLPERFDTSRNYEITFWAKNDTNKVQTAIYQKAIGDFQKLYPNITVNIRLYTDYARIYNDVITNIATGTTPNVCITYPDHIATYLTGEDTVVPLDSLMDDPNYGLGGSALSFDSPTRGEIVPQFLSECAIYALHGGLLRQQGLCGKAGLHPAGNPDLGLHLAGQRGRYGEKCRRDIQAQRPEGIDPLHIQVHG